MILVHAIHPMLNATILFWLTMVIYFLCWHFLVQSSRNHCWYLLQHTYLSYKTCIFSAICRNADLFFPHSLQGWEIMWRDYMRIPNEVWQSAPLTLMIAVLYYMSVSINYTQPASQNISLNPDHNVLVHKVSLSK
jgi:hypothetical protein